MPNAKQKVDTLLFNYESTYRTDYQRYIIKEYPKTVYKPRVSHYVRGLPDYKNVHTMREWRGDRPPFNILHKPKDVVRTNPRIVQQAFEKPIDIDREEVQKTRPRLVMTPAVSMDDIEDPRAREILCNDMYTSDMTRATREAVTPSVNVAAPLPGLPAQTNPIFLPKLQPPVVSPEWRMESVSWDGKQLRSYCDPTKSFWLTQKLPRCRMCEETAIVKQHRDNLRKMNQSK
ncbi:uncharacterized protein LOC123706477 [Colias croceus]|uniref:uncharacterized protein LOC123706477 n=1 Tax=Colias crocea TaxID=72248 RepID=UPI001E27DAB7|nr:uncharacterized protein LOC123706477 [Colias croceus]